MLLVPTGSACRCRRTVVGTNVGLGRIDILHGLVRTVDKVCRIGRGRIHLRLQTAIADRHIARTDNGTERLAQVVIRIAGLAINSSILGSERDGRLHIASPTDLRYKNERQNR